MQNTDFNGDGRDDLLWRNDQGMVGYWYGQEEGGFAINSRLTYAPLDWMIIGTGDFDGDGQADILWRNENGTIGYWYGEQDGSFTVNNKLAGVPNSWWIEGTGDFNGDGRDDILWRHEDGRVGTWLGQADGSFMPGIEITVPLNWWITGVGDFDGDGRSDILWQGGGGEGNWVGTWSGGADGSFVINGELTYIRPSPQFIGDYNNDGLDDFVLADDWSFYSVVYARPGGGFSTDEYEPFGDSSSATTMRSVGDFNGDGQADTVFRHTDGRLFVNGEIVAAVSNNWHLTIDPVDQWWF